MLLLLLPLLLVLVLLRQLMMIWGRCWLLHILALPVWHQHRRRHLHCRLFVCNRQWLCMCSWQRLCVCSWWWLCVCSWQ